MIMRETARIFFETMVRKSKHTKLISYFPISDTGTFREYIGQYSSGRGILLKKVRVFADGRIEPIKQLSSGKTLLALNFFWVLYSLYDTCFV